MFVLDFPWKSHHPKLAWGTPIMGIQPTAHQPLWIPGFLVVDNPKTYTQMIYGFGTLYSIWLVVDLPLWKMMEWVTVGMMKFPICGKIKTVLKPPTRYFFNKMAYLEYLPVLGNPSRHIFSCTSTSWKTTSPSGFEIDVPQKYDDDYGHFGYTNYRVVIYMYNP